MSMGVKLAALAATATGSDRRNRRRQVRPDVPGPGTKNAGAPCRRVDHDYNRPREAIAPFAWAREARAPNPSRDAPNGRDSPSRRRRSPAAWTSFVDRESSACPRLNRRTDRRRAASATVASTARRNLAAGETLDGESGYSEVAGQGRSDGALGRLRRRSLDYPFQLRPEMEARVPRFFRR